MHLNPGTLLLGGRYKIVRFIASGGFGCTYEAEHTLLGKRVAIKEFFPKTFCNRESDTVHVTVGTQSQKPLVEKLKKKFIDEARSIAQLSHNGIVKVTDVFKENGTAYYVMDYIEGKSLSKIIDEKGPLSEKEALGYIRQVCDALSYVHCKNRLHLDIKPANIMIDENNHAILIDFGASKQYDEENGQNTSTLIGKTPGYAPIEQMGNNVSRFKPATDIYALGATLYKCLSGKTPVEANDLADGEELEPLPANISESTKKAIKSAMEVGSKKRPQTVEEFVSLLDESPIDPNPNDIVEEPTILDRHITSPTPEHSNTTGPSEPNKKPNFAPTNDNDKKPAIAPIRELSKNPAIVQINESDKKPLSTPINIEEPSSNKKTKLYIGAASIIALLVICVFAFGGKSDSEELNEDILVPVAYLEEEDKNVKEDPYNGHEYVDLGLPSGLKWATCNVGAQSPEEYGDYFAWGETSPKQSYDSNNSETYGKDDQWLKSHGYIGSNGNLAPSHDAAHQNWGSTWRMPTKREIEELVYNTTRNWTTLNGKYGQLLTSKKNGNSIFLPAAGWRYGSSSSRVGEYGYYWSSTPYESGSESVCYLDFGSGSFRTDWFYRNDGFSVRPVSE